MSDIVARMRCRTLMWNCGNGDVRDVPDEDCLEAANEIERLRARETRLQKALQDIFDMYGETLRAGEIAIAALGEEKK